MPQLNPAPWFFILILSWASLLLVFKTMTLASSMPNNTETTALATQQNPSWSWPWA